MTEKRALSYYAIAPAPRLKPGFCNDVDHAGTVETAASTLPRIDGLMGFVYEAADDIFTNVFYSVKQSDSRWPGTHLETGSLLHGYSVDEVHAGLTLAATQAIDIQALRFKWLAIDEFYVQALKLGFRLDVQDADGLMLTDRVDQKAYVMLDFSRVPQPSTQKVLQAISFENTSREFSLDSSAAQVLRFLVAAKSETAL